jgi:hypothetical protein
MENRLPPASENHRYRTGGQRRSQKGVRPFGAQLKAQNSQEDKRSFHNLSFDKFSFRLGGRSAAARSTLASLGTEGGPISVLHVLQQFFVRKFAPRLMTTGGAHVQLSKRTWTHSAGAER